MINSMLLSFILHASMFIILLPIGCGSGDGNGGGPDNDPGKIAPKASKEEVEINFEVVEGGIEVAEQEVKETQQGLKDCVGDAWYGGIGIINDYTEESVREVYEGYPAANAGMKAGDVIVYQSESDIRGEPGTIIIIKVRRGDNTLTFSIMRDKICIYGEDI